MIVYPNAKINLGLNIVSKRTDGFHDIETCFYPVSLTDILEFIECEEQTEFTSSGIKIPGNPEENICLHAWNLLQNDFHIPPIKIHLHKIIPIGAGLGGGSSDGTFILKHLSEYFELNLNRELLADYAEKLGSDCAFFLSNSPTIGTGRGNILNKINLNLDNYKVVIVYPGVHISTKLAYSSILPEKPEYNLKDVLELPVSEWQGKLTNQFEKGLINRFPVIEELLNKLLKYGAEYAALSGSGSAIFGLFKNEIPEEIDSAFNNYIVYYDK